MKKLFNDHGTMVEDMIDGFVAAYPQQVARGRADRLVRRAKPADPNAKVTLAIGNGSGHEPIAMGFIGPGLLDANIVGDVFTAPSADMIFDGLAEITGEAGTLLLVSRHEGDVINANGAVMMARDEGLNIRALLMYDDVSSAPKGEEHERRGAAGTLFIYKILGAAGETGMDLDALEALGIAVRDRIRTLGAAVSPGISPITGARMFELPDDEVFIGMGVHGEPGVSRRQIEPVKDLVGFMMGELLDDMGDMAIAPDQKTVVLINGSGATSMMELLTIYREVEAILRRRGMSAIAPAIGSLSTTWDTAGFSISLMVPTDQMLTFWQAGHRTPFFPHICNGDIS